MNAWDEPQKTVAEFARKQGIRYPIGLNGSRAAQQYSVRGIPAGFWIDRDGNLAGDAGRGKALETELRRLLK